MVNIYQYLLITSHMLRQPHGCNNIPSISSLNPHPNPMVCVFFVPPRTQEQALCTQLRMKGIRRWWSSCCTRALESTFVAPRVSARCIWPPRKAGWGLQYGLEDWWVPDRTDEDSVFSPHVKLRVMKPTDLESCSNPTWALGVEPAGTRKGWKHTEWNQDSWCICCIVHFSLGSWIKLKWTFCGCVFDQWEHRIPHEPVWRLRFDIVYHINK